MCEAQMVDIGSDDIGTAGKKGRTGGSSHSMWVRIRSAYLECIFLWPTTTAITGQSGQTIASHIFLTHAARNAHLIRTTFALPTPF